MSNANLQDQVQFTNHGHIRSARFLVKKHTVVLSWAAHHTEHAAAQAACLLKGKIIDAMELAEMTDRVRTIEWFYSGQTHYLEPACV